MHEVNGVFSDKEKSRLRILRSRIRRFVRIHETEQLLIWAIALGTVAGLIYMLL